MTAKAIPTEFDRCVEIYVPTECRCGKLLPEDIRAEVLEEVKSSMGIWFGGGSVKSVKKADLRVESIEGFWPLASGDTANERLDVVYSNATGETLEEHSEELAGLTANLANRLTQEAVACRVDGKMRIYPSTQDPKPHRCAGGVSTGKLPIPLEPDEKDRMRALQASLQRISSDRDVRDLFCNVLHYDRPDDLNAELPVVDWPDKLRECLAPRTAPRIIADENGFKILYLQLAEDYLRKGHERLLVQRIIKDDPTLRGLVVVSDVDQKEWHLINAKFETEEGKKDRLRLRRMRVGKGQSVRTAVERLAMVDIETAGEGSSAAELQDLHDRAFDVESVSKEFFNEISNWYFWALSQVEFPTDPLIGDDDEKHRATSLIRFLTRMIFCWFLKEKNLIPPSLFREKDLADILVDLDLDTCTYHQAILQNLFFATLNQRMGKDSKGNAYRAFAKDEGFPKNKSTYGVDTLYRYEEHFQDPDKALSHFADVPFLNGGLFECLDRTDEDSGKRLYVDGFSRSKKKRARVPNRILFSGEQTVDLSEAYGDTGRRNAQVRGLLRILHAYNFTVEENTPIDEEIALDPELLGKVFENLLASYNEETKTTARKQTGSFYTPRPIVEYMVDESLKAHLVGSLTKLGRKEEEAHEQLDILLGYADEERSFPEEETDALLEAIHTCKILDPACGSGAFPIGMLQKLVHVVHKLDPDNVRWKQLQIDHASKIPDSSARNAAIKAIEHDFEENGDDYGRKLYLIESCLYGADIQPIAIQISKLRFFISLICDQKTNRDKAKNHGIRALPNLETKFVAANTLIGLPEIDQLALVGPRVNEIEGEIESLYHRHFSIQRRDQKLSLQKKLKELRKELGQVIAESLGSSKKAEQLARWDPFDSQASANFFDPHWMFGRDLSSGFDIVIGNPPYISVEKFSGTDQQAQWKETFTTYAARGDVYCFFYERGVNLLRKGGTLTYITSNKWMRAGYGQKLRGFLSEKVNTQTVLDFGMAQNFGAATTYTCITHLMAGEPDGKVMSCYATDDRAAIADPAGYFAANAVAQKKLGADTWVVLSKDRQRIKDLVEAQGVPLERWDIQISYGIKTGFNEAFYLTGEQRDALIAEDPASEELIGKLLRGRDVDRYKVNWENTWQLIIKFGAYEYLEDRYPAIYRHLAQFEKKLKERGQCKYSRSRNTQNASKPYPGQHHWLELDNNPTGEFLGRFSKAKVMYPNMTRFLPFYFDAGDGFLTNDKGFIINSDAVSLCYITAFLNSHLFRCCFRDNFPELMGNTYEVRKILVDKLPLKKPEAQQVEVFEKLVPLVQFAKHAGEDGPAQLLEDVIEACVMECYFGDHMAQRDLLFLDGLAPQLAAYDPASTEAKQRDFLKDLSGKINAAGSKTRERLDRIPRDSPELLAVIKEEGKV